MKHVITILLALMTLSVLLTGCSGRQAEGNISTTPDGTVNGSNLPAENTMPNKNNTPANSVVPGTDRNDNIMTDRPDNSIGSEMEESWDDMVDGAKDTIDDMQNSIGEPTNSRARRSGTGMTGGR